MDAINTEWSKTTKYIVGIGLVFVGIYLINLSREVISLLIIAALVAVITRPVINWLYLRAHFSRGAAVAVVYLGVIILFPLALILAIPAIVNAVHYVLSLDYGAFLRGALQWVIATLASIKAAQLPVGSLDAYVDQIANDLLASFQSSGPAAAPVTPSVGTILQSLGTAFRTTFSTITGLVGAVVSQVVLIIFILLASIYMNLSAHTYRESFLHAVPAPYQPEMTILLARIGKMWSAFFRGELTLMLVIGVMSWLGLTVLGIPGAPYLGIIAGLLELVPNLGPIIATIPAVIVALLQGSSFFAINHVTMAALVIAFYILVQQLENNLIVPRVLGGAVDLPPLVVMTGVLVGATAYGVLGALLATPIIATGREIFRYIYAKMLGKNPYPPDEQISEAAPALSVGLRQLLDRWSQRVIRRRTPAQPDPSTADAAHQPSGDTDGPAHPPENQ